MNAGCLSQQHAEGAEPLWPSPERQPSRLGLCEGGGGHGRPRAGRRGAGLCERSSYLFAAVEFFPGDFSLWRTVSEFLNLQTRVKKGSCDCAVLSTDFKGLLGAERS